MIKDASGTREAEPLLVTAGEEKYISDWSRDGKYVLYAVRGEGHEGWDIFALPLDGERKPIPIVKTSFHETWPTFSPDGKYMAYQSNESGRMEIYVHEFSEARTKWQVSTSGGTQVHWRADGKELFYRAGTSLMRCPSRPAAASRSARRCVCSRRDSPRSPCAAITAPGLMGSASSFWRRSRATWNVRRRSY